jgi:hypothetical protein
MGDYIRAKIFTGDKNFFVAGQIARYRPADSPGLT